MLTAFQFASKRKGPGYHPRSRCSCRYRRETRSKILIIPSRTCWTHPCPNTIFNLWVSPTRIARKTSSGWSITVYRPSARLISALDLASHIPASAQRHLFHCQRNRQAHHPSTTSPLPHPPTTPPSSPLPTLPPNAAPPLTIVPKSVCAPKFNLSFPSCGGLLMTLPLLADWRPRPSLCREARVLGGRWRGGSRRVMRVLCEAVGGGG